jgi:hypothetical protein
MGAAGRGVGGVRVGVVSGRANPQATLGGTCLGVHGATDSATSWRRASWGHAQQVGTASARGAGRRARRDPPPDMGRHSWTPPAEEGPGCPGRPAAGRLGQGMGDGGRLKAAGAWAGPAAARFRVRSLVSRVAAVAACEGTPESTTVRSTEQLRRAAPRWVGARSIKRAARAAGRGLCGGRTG